MTQIQCECGDVASQQCHWAGPLGEMVLVEYVPEYLRARHAVAGGRGSHPHNGAERLRCERTCAERLVESDPDWTTLVG